MSNKNYYIVSVADEESKSNLKKLNKDKESYFIDSHESLDEIIETWAVNDLSAKINWCSDTGAYLVSIDQYVYLQEVDLKKEN